MVKYSAIIDGEGVELEPLRCRKSKAWEILRMACCDCGLIHSFSFAIEDNGNLGIAVRRDNRNTARPIDARDSLTAFVYPNQSRSNQKKR